MRATPIPLVLALALLGATAITATDAAAGSSPRAEACAALRADAAAPTLRPAALKRCDLEDLLTAEARAVEAEYRTIFHHGEAAGTCEVTSSCAPRSDFTGLGAQTLFTPKQIPFGKTPADYHVSFDAPSAIYQVDQGQADDADWRATAARNPPSAARLNNVLCSAAPLDAIWKRHKAKEGDATFWQPVMILQRTFLD